MVAMDRDTGLPSGQQPERSSKRIVQGNFSAAAPAHKGPGHRSGGRRNGERKAGRRKLHPCPLENLLGGFDREVTAFDLEHGTDLGSVAFGRSKTIPEEMLEASQARCKAADPEWLELLENLDILLKSNETNDFKDLAKERLSSDEVGHVFKLVEQHMVALSMDQTGCRVVQFVMGELFDTSRQVVLANKLRDNIEEAMQSPHGNHVLQKCIELLPPSATAFMLGELQRLPEDDKGLPAVVGIARNRYGCRVLERFLEHFSAVPPHNKDLEKLLQPIFEESNFKMLCKDHYGNFVVQHVLEHGTPNQKRSIAAMLKTNLKEMAIDPHACSVLGKALSYTASQDPNLELALALAEYDVPDEQKPLIVQMANLQGGHGGPEAAERLLTLLEADNAEAAKKALLKAKHQLMANRSELQASRNGKLFLEACLPKAAEMARQKSEKSPVQERQQFSRSARYSSLTEQASRKAQGGCK